MSGNPARHIIITGTPSSEFISPQKEAHSLAKDLTKEDTEADDVTFRITGWLRKQAADEVVAEWQKKALRRTYMGSRFRFVQSRKPRARIERVGDPKARDVPMVPSYTNGGNYMRAHPLLKKNPDVLACFTRALTGHAPTDEYRDRLFPRATPDHMGCLYGAYETHNHILDQCRHFARKHKHGGWYANTIARFIKANKHMFTFRGRGGDLEVQYVEGEFDIMLEKLASMGFGVNMPVDDQEDLELRVRPRIKGGDEGGIDLAVSVLQMRATKVTKIPGGLDEVVRDRLAISIDGNVDILGKKGLDVIRNKPGWWVHERRPRGKYYWDRDWEKWWDTIIPKSKGLGGGMEGAKLKVLYIDAKAEQWRQEERVLLAEERWRQEHCCNMVWFS